MKLPADRVRAAVAKLSESRKPVTVASICATVRSLYGASISSNTIKRNHLAGFIRVIKLHKSGLDYLVPMTAIAWNSTQRRFWLWSEIAPTLYQRS